MASPFFKKVTFTATALVVATLSAIYYVMTSVASEQQGAPVDPLVRYWVIGIAFSASCLAVGIGFAISRSLRLRVGRLKRVAEGLLAEASENPRGSDPEDDLASLERSVTAVSGELRTLVDRLRLESARRETILASMAEGVLAVDPDARVIFCNRAFLNAVRFRGESFEGLSLVQMVRDPALHTLIRSILAGGESGKLRLNLTSDMPRTFDVEATPLAMASGRGAIAIFHDTTDLERLEQVRKDFVANVSHEFRTPLAGIIGYSDTLLDGAIDDEANRKRFIEIIRANAVRLGSIASDLLVLSELESGEDPHELETFSVRGVVETAFLTVDAEARERGVTLVHDDIADVYVSGSRLRLEQAILNLLANAIKFNRPGGEVRMRVGSDSSGQIEIVVSDTGVGIPSVDLPRIFERFYRVDKARSRQVGGTGLGLSIVKHAVERMHGAVSVESQLGKGSAFKLVIPQAAAAYARVRT